MRVTRSLISLVIASLFLVPTANPQTAASSAQAITTLQNALTALVGKSSINDITLTGTVQRIAGSDNETGTASYKAVTLANRLDLSLSQGTSSEIRGQGANGPGGNWIGPDGVVHEIALHNLLTDAGWFPIFTLSNVLSAPNGALAYVGPETKNGVAVLHVRYSQQTSNDTLLQQLTQMDIYLNASTLLPVALDYNTHSDNNGLLDIPVEFLFSNYSSVGSLNIPLHVQKYLNGSLFLDVEFQQATVNSGLSSSSSVFTIQ